MYRILLAFIVICFLLPSSVFAEELNAGFVEGLWYSGEPVIAGEPTRIYVALRNNSDNDLTGTVRFSDNGTRIGTSYISALPGRLVEAWIDWKPSYGEHRISASLSDIRIHTLGENPESAAVGDTIAEDTIFVDYDTDKDGIGNETDTDDDGDGVSDADEKVKGTDPLKANVVEKKETTEITARANNDDEGSKEKSEPKKRTETTQQGSGLETYIPNGAARSIITTITEKIETTKSSLDDYRDTRADAIAEYFNDGNTGSSTSIQTTNDEDVLATITRTRSNDDGVGFFKAVTDGGKALIRGFYSLILWLASSALAYPAILELIFLLFIMYMIYRTARRFGRRRIGN